MDDDIAAEEWRLAHAQRQQLVRTCQDYEALTKVGLRLDGCCKQWGDRGAGSLRCGQDRICPVCALAVGLERERRLRLVLSARQLLDRQVVLLTVGQIDVAGEPLSSAIARMRSVMHRSSSGGPGRRWRAACQGWVYTLQITRGCPNDMTGQPCPTGADELYWQVRCHMLVVAGDGVGREQMQDTVRAAMLKYGCQVVAASWHPSSELGRSCRYSGPAHMSGTDFVEYVACLRGPNARGLRIAAVGKGTLYSYYTDGGKLDLAAR